MTSDRVLNIMALMNELEGPTNAYRHSVRRATRTASDSPENEAAKARGTAALLDIEQAVRHWVATHPATDDQTDGWHLTPQTLDLFVRALVNEVDYDIHKGYECGEEDGKDHYPELVAEATEMLNAITNQQHAS